MYKELFVFDLYEKLAFEYINIQQGDTIKYWHFVMYLLGSLCRIEDG